MTTPLGWHREVSHSEAYGVLYFLSSGVGGPIKIGFATSSAAFKRRVACLQGGNPDVLTVLAAIPVSANEVRECEFYAHGVFKSARIRGEWFRPIPELLAAIDALNHGDGIACAFSDAKLAIGARRLREETN